MIKEAITTCKRCKEKFLFKIDSSVVDKVLDEDNYICVTCEDEMERDKMETINIKFDKEQLEDVVKKVTEKLKETKKNNFYELSDTAHQESYEKWSLMYLEFNEVGSTSEKGKLYFGHAFHTLTKDYASDFDFSESSRKKVNQLKEQGWKEEVVYK